MLYGLFLINFSKHLSLDQSEETLAFKLEGKQFVLQLNLAIKEDNFKLDYEVLFPDFGCLKQSLKRIEFIHLKRCIITFHGTGGNSKAVYGCLPLVISLLSLFIWGNFLYRNIVHGSDSNDSAKKEISLWFNDNELVDWKLMTESMIYED